MHGQHSQTQFLGQKSDVGAVDAATDTDDHIIGTPFPFLSNAVHQGLKFFLPFIRRRNMPGDCLQILVVVVADAVVIKRQNGIIIRVQHAQ